MVGFARCVCLVVLCLSLLCGCVLLLVVPCVFARVVSVLCCLFLWLYKCVVRCVLYCCSGCSCVCARLLLCVCCYVLRVWCFCVCECYCVWCLGFGVSLVASCCVCLVSFALIGLLGSAVVNGVVRVVACVIVVLGLPIDWCVVV